MRKETLNVYERPEAEELVLVYESNFLGGSIEQPFEQGEYNLDNPNDPSNP